jgi:hypothetical protein
MTETDNPTPLQTLAAWRSLIAAEGDTLRPVVLICDAGKTLRTFGEDGMSFEEMDDFIKKAASARDVKSWRVEAADPTVPEGFEPIEAFYNPATGICFIHGPLDCNDESHDCDLMGCGSVTPHVTYCGPLPTGNAMPTPTSEEASR